MNLLVRRLACSFIGALLLVLFVLLCAKRKSPPPSLSGGPLRNATRTKTLGVWMIPRGHDSPTSPAVWLIRSSVIPSVFLGGARLKVHGLQRTIVVTS